MCGELGVGEFITCGLIPEALVVVMKIRIVLVETILGKFELMVFLSSFFEVSLELLTAKNLLFVVFIGDLTKLTESLDLLFEFKDELLLTGSITIVLGINCRVLEHTVVISSSWVRLLLRPLLLVLIDGWWWASSHATSHVTRHWLLLDLGNRRG